MTDLINEAFSQTKELVMQALGELVAEGTFPAEPIPSFIAEIPADAAVPAVPGLFFSLICSPFCLCI